MSRPIKISAGILNFRIENHTPERYIDLMKDMYNLKKIVRLHGDRYAVISSIDLSEMNEAIVFGAISTFTKIETDTRWFDTTSFSEASDQKVSSIRIPPDLYPNSAAFYFIFDGTTHKLYFQVYSQGKNFSHRLSKKFFSEVADDLMIFEKFGSVHITVQQSKAGLDKLFGLRSIKEISIMIERPNPDIFDDDFESKLEAFMDESHTGRFDLSFRAERGDSVVPNEGIKRASQIALSNGRVNVRGRSENGTTITQSSADFPEELIDKYDPDASTERSAFRSLVDMRRRGRN